MLLAERIIPTGIMARYQVTLDIALRRSAGIRFVAFYRRWGSLSQNLLSRAIRLLDRRWRFQRLVRGAHPT